MQPENVEEVRKIFAELRADFEILTEVKEDLNGNIFRVPVNLELLVLKCQEAIRKLHPLCGVPPEELPALVVAHAFAPGVTDVPLDSPSGKPESHWLVVLLEAMQDEAESIRWRTKSIGARSRHSPRELLDLAVETHYGTLSKLIDKAGVQQRIVSRIRAGNRVHNIEDRKALAEAIRAAGIECDVVDLLNPTTKPGRGRPKKPRPEPGQ